MTENTIHAHKQAAVRFLEMVSAGKIDEAYREFVDMRGKHHNPFFPEGFPALREAMIQNEAQFPDKRLDIQNVLGDDELVAVHSSITLKPGEPAMAVVHLVRFQGDLIVEMWDVGQAIPADSPNKDGAF